MSASNHIPAPTEHEHENERTNMATTYQTPTERGATLSAMFASRDRTADGQDFVSWRVVLLQYAEQLNERIAAMPACYAWHVNDDPADGRKARVLGVHVFGWALKFQFEHMLFGNAGHYDLTDGTPPPWPRS